MTIPTGPAAGVHLPWAEVPAAVPDVGGRGRWRSARGHSRPAGGFSPGATAVLDCPGGAIFVKAVGTTLNPESPAIHRREAVISASLPEAPEFPRLLDVYDDGDWVALAFEAIEGRPPAASVGRGRTAGGGAALDALHDALTPNPLPDAALGRRSTPASLRRLGRAGVRVTAARRAHPWAGRNLDRLADLESAWPDAVRGLDLAALRCALRQPARDGQRRRVRGLAACGVGNAASSTSGLGAVGVVEGGPGARIAVGPVRWVRPVDPDTLRWCWRPLQRVLGRATPCTGAAGAAYTAPVPGGAGGGGTGLVGGA